MSLLCKREHGSHVRGQLMSRYAENHLASILSSCFYRKCSAESSEPALQHRGSAIFMTRCRSRAPCLFLHLGRGADAEVTVKEKNIPITGWQLRGVFGRGSLFQAAPGELNKVIWTRVNSAVAPTLGPSGPRLQPSVNTPGNSTSALLTIWYLWGCPCCFVFPRKQCILKIWPAESFLKYT